MNTKLAYPWFSKRKAFIKRNLSFVISNKNLGLRTGVLIRDYLDVLSIYRLTAENAAILIIMDAIILRVICGVTHITPVCIVDIKDTVKEITKSDNNFLKKETIDKIDNFTFKYSLIWNLEVLLIDNYFIKSLLSGKALIK